MSSYEDRRALRVFAAPSRKDAGRREGLKKKKLSALREWGARRESENQSGFKFDRSGK